MSQSKGKSSIELPPKPIPPEPDDCCGSGCDPCVHDTYANSLSRWKKRVFEIEKKQQKKQQKKLLRK